jgi:hypothetical protein
VSHVACGIVLVGSPKETIIRVHCVMECAAGTSGDSLISAIAAWALLEGVGWARDGARKEIDTTRTTNRTMRTCASSDWSTDRSRLTGESVVKFPLSVGWLG